MTDRINTDAVPSDLLELPQWALWRAPDKMPLTATGTAASSTDPATWTTFDAAMTTLRTTNGAFTGTGFVFSATDPFCGIDLDHCVDEVGNLKPWAQDIVNRFDSYSEFSPNDGVHIIIRGSKPGTRCNTAYEDGKAEIYDRDRYLTVTGNRVPDTPATINNRQDALAAFYHELFGDEPETTPPQLSQDQAGAAVPVDDSELLGRIRASKQGDRFNRLWAGDTSGHNDDDSAADMAMCNILAFYTRRDRQCMDRLFRQSGLMREKWDSKRGDSTYGWRTIDRAIADCKEVYDPGHLDLKSSSKPPDDRPVIVINSRPASEIAIDAMAAITNANNPPNLFVRSGDLVRIDMDEKHRPVVRNVEGKFLAYELARAAYCVRKTKEGRLRDVHPPRNVIDDLSAHPAWKAPPLEAIVEQPILRPDGHLLVRPGYDALTRTFYVEGPALKMPLVPETPSRDDVAVALELLQDLTGDFPFADDASRANALAVLLDPAIRQYINACSPLAIIDAPQAGSGKSLLARVCATVATGRDAAMMAMPRDDDEMRKRLFAALLGGCTFIVIDNVDSMLYHPSLALALTTSTITDRMLGKSENITVAQRATWLATGNNIRLGGDMPRRCFWIRLDAKSSRPWLRGEEKFAHPNLIDWATKNRGDLLAALLTLARGWIVAGRPPSSSPVIGGFEAWSRTIGGILEFAGMAGFLGNLEDLYEQVDDDTPVWEAFLQQWHQRYGDKPVTASTIAGWISDADNQALRDVLPEQLTGALATETDRTGTVTNVRLSSGFTKKLGRLLRHRVGRRFNDEGLRVERAADETHKNVARWRVTQDQGAG